jgi:hypothetical protein
VTYGKFLCHAGISPNLKGITMKLLQDKKTSLQNLNGKDLIYDRISSRRRYHNGITTEMIRT